VKAIFELGVVVSTPSGLDALSLAEVDPAELLARHAAGDWGELDAHDRRANNRAIKDGTRILSAYTLPGGRKLWIITEADRSVTTILLPEEY
jgi:hypothetical protein